MPNAECLIWLRGANNDGMEQNNIINLQKPKWKNRSINNLRIVMPSIYLNPIMLNSHSFTE